MNTDEHGSDQQQEAVHEMLRFVETNRATLGNVSVKELIHEGHRIWVDLNAP
jgi:hypothetical protein